MGIFTIVSIAVAAVIFIVGVVLLKKNVRPILGFLMVIFALVIFIGMSMSAKEIEKSVTKIVSRVSK